MMGLDEFMTHVELMHAAIRKARDAGDTWTNMAVIFATEKISIAAMPTARHEEIEPALDQLCTEMRAEGVILGGEGWTVLAPKGEPHISPQYCADRRLAIVVQAKHAVHGRHMLLSYITEKSGGGFEYSEPVFEKPVDHLPNLERVQLFVPKANAANQP